MAEGSTGNIRSIYVEWALRDKVSGPADQINRRLDLTRDRAKGVQSAFQDTASAMEQSAGNAGRFFALCDQQVRETVMQQQSAFQDTASALEQSVGSAGQYFAYYDQQVRESNVQQQAYNRQLGETATQYNRLKDRARDFAEAVKTRIQSSFRGTTNTMEQSVGSAGQYFALYDQQIKESSIQQQTHNRLLGEAAVQYNRLKTSARDFAETTKAKMQQASAAINEHRGAILGIGAALTGAGYLGYNYYAAGTKDLGNYEDAYATFVKNVGADTDTLIARMQEASAGTVSETQIILNANKAMLMDIPVEHLPRYMEVARAAARSMGEDMSYMFDSIVTGSARESPMILDNLSLRMNGLTAAEEAYASSLGKSARTLSEEERRRVFLNYVLENSDEILQRTDNSQESLNEQTARSKVTWEEFRRELTSGARPAIAGILGITEAATGALRDMPAPLKAVIGTAGLAGTVIAGLGGPLLINAVAVAYLIANYDTLARSLVTTKTAMALHATTLVTRLIPASVATAYAQGGLTAALWAGAAALQAFLAPWLPIIGAVGLAVGAVLLLQDVLVKGWDNSYLGQFVGWLLEKLPFLQPVADAVAGGFQWFRDAVVGAASGVGAFLDQIGPLKYLILGPVMPLLLLKDLLTGTGDTAGMFLRDLAVIPGALQAFIADPLGTITGLADTFITGITSLPQKAASALQGVPILGPAIGMLLDGARAVSGFIDRLGPLKVALLGPIAPLVFLAQHVDTVAGGIQWLWGTLTGATSGVSTFLDRFGPLKYLLLGPVGALIYLAKNFDHVTAAVRNFIDWVAVIPRTLGAAAAAVTDNPIFRILSGATKFAANPLGTALEIITPKVKPEVIAPDMDPEYYTKGSIAFKVRTPKVRPDILPPDPSALDRLGSLLAGALAVPIAPLFPAVAAPALAMRVLAPELPAITPPEIPRFEAPPSPGQPPRSAGNNVTITIQNTIEVHGAADGNLEKQIRDALSRSTADQVKLVERRLIDQLRACGI